MSSYRPITNLPSISKVIGKLVLSKLNEHLTSNNLWTNNQSAYRKGFSMETGLLYCSHEIYSKIDAGQFLYVISSDFSAAFDTIDYQLLLIILEKKVGLTGTETLLRVMVDGEHSSKISVGTGAPQGSVLGPILFSLYLLTLFDLLIIDSVPYHFHADDPQLFFKRSLDESTFPHF